jgi:uncharacterized protein YfeS
MAVSGLDDYLKALQRFVDDAYGRRMRAQFQTTDGKSELAMLAAPTREEYEQFCRLTAAMTVEEKQNAVRLTDEQVAQIAERAAVDPALAAIFINGYVLKKLKANEKS